MNSWLYLNHPPLPPAWNMACDEWLLNHVEEFNRPILRTYGWNRPAITLGYFQEFPHALTQTHTIIRRPTGGAMVFHDHDLTFSVILPPTHPWKKLPVCDRYRKIHEPIARIFSAKGLNPTVAESCQPHLPQPSGRNIPGAQCFSRVSRYDVLLQGRKIAGGAQRVNRQGLLHQGSIQSEDFPRPDPSELHSIWETMGIHFEDLSLSPIQEKEISALADQKYGTREWNERTDETVQKMSLRVLSHG